MIRRQLGKSVKTHWTTRGSIQRYQNCEVIFTAINYKEAAEKLLINLKTPIIDLIREDINSVEIDVLWTNGHMQLKDLPKIIA